MSKLRILILCHDVIGTNMAGPGIRYQNIARVLSKDFIVTLGVFSEANRSDPEVIVVNPDTNEHRRYIDDADIIFAQWLSRKMIDYAVSRGKILIFDLYAPVPIEYLANLEFSRNSITKHQREEFEAVIDMYKDYFTVGELFTCSNVRQRDFWAGFLTASNLFDSDAFRHNKIRSKLLICPMGIDTKVPKPKKLLLRTSLPEIKKDDFILIWTGGIWDWFDAKVIVRAMSEIKDPKIKLVFLGTKHPNAIYQEEMAEAVASRELAAELGLLGKSVFFLDGWIPYDERASYFLDADAAIYADKDSLETRFSHRTRVLDHFWAEIPTICSSGDYMSEIIEHKRLGIVVESRSSKDFAQAITKLKGDQKLYRQIKKSLHENRSEFSWEASLQPLVSSLKSLNPQERQEQIKEISRRRQEQGKLPLKRRIRRSAKILLKGQ